METNKNAVDFKTFQSLLGVYDIKLKLLTHSVLERLLADFIHLMVKTFMLLLLKLGTIISTIAHIYAKLINS